MNLNFKKDKISLTEDRYLLKRLPQFDNPEKIGSIYITDNVNIRESKICEVFAFSEKVENPVPIGTLVYCTRYGKQIMKDIVGRNTDFDGDMWVITRDAGILATVELDDSGNPVNIIPRFDRLWCKELNPKERVSEGGIILTEKEDIAHADYLVLATGPGKIDKDSDEIIEMELEIGDKFLSNTAAGVQVSWFHSGKIVKYRLITESEAILKYE